VTRSYSPSPLNDWSFRTPTSLGGGAFGGLGLEPGPATFIGGGGAGGLQPGGLALMSNRFLCGNGGKAGIFCGGPPFASVLKAGRGALFGRGGGGGEKAGVAAGGLKDAMAPLEAADGILFPMGLSFPR